MSNNPADYIEFDPPQSEQEPLDAEQVFMVYHNLRQSGDVDAATLFLQERPTFSIDAYHAWVAEIPLPMPDIPKIELIKGESVPFTPKPDGGFNGANPYDQPLDYDQFGHPMPRGKAHAEGFFNQKKAVGGPDHDDYRGNKWRKE